MNNVEAKFILQGYRPNGADAGDATFAAALEQTRADPSLHDWFARELAFDRAVSAKLGEIRPPAGLREAILAGGRVTSSDTTRRRWWEQPAFMAAAAGVAVLFALGLALWPRMAVASPSLAEFALADTMHSETHGGHGADTAALHAMLSAPSTRLGSGLPVDFEALRKAGCRTVTFAEQPVLEVCFKRDGAWFHCYIARRADFPALAAALTPVLSDRNGAGIASWADASHLFVVVSKTGRAPLQRLL
ncbi:MAG: hypothetical protein HYV75_06600 [Opitutae bacterium]|nr:hypothetical protein [Opitutae bacterium]